MPEQSAAQRLREAPARARDLGMAALTDEIVATHHVFAREQGQRIQPLLDKVVRVHGGKEARLRLIWVLFQQMHAELLQHMLKEEAVLFPWCKWLEQPDQAAPETCGTIGMPLRVMGIEHDRAAQQLAQLRRLSDDFCPPPWACSSLHALYHELQAYCADLETHMHIENDLLFPAALRRQQELSSPQAG